MNAPGVLVAAFLLGGASAQAWLLDPRKAPLPQAMAQTLDVWAHDVDGDGDRDLIVANLADGWRYPTAGSWVLHNDGGGRFTNRTPLDTSARIFLAAGDFDGDGDPDVLYRDYYAGGDGLGRNTGSGSLVFTKGIAFDGRRLAVADADGDGFLDVASGRGLYRNLGNGAFADVTATHLPALTFSGEAVPLFCDVDGDRDVDLVVGDGGGGGAKLLVNDGGGRFADRSTWLPTDRDRHAALVAFDADGDRDDDLALAVRGGADRLYRNDGNGRFTAHDLPTRGDACAIAAADLDGDGDQDLVVGEAAGAWILGNSGGGSFSYQSPRWRPGKRATTAIAAFDADGDGDPDLVLGAARNPTDPWLARPWGLENRLFENDGSGRFAGEDDGMLPASFADGWTAVGDLDGDGDLDVLHTGAPGAGGSRLWRNDGFGRLTAVELRLPVGGRPYLGDLDGDNDLDAVALDPLGGFHVLRNPGDGLLWPWRSYWLPAGTRTEGLALGDLDGDGDLDVFVATHRFDPLFGFILSAPDSVWLGDGLCNFAEHAGALPASPTTAATDAAIGDLDGDGDLDVAGDGGTWWRNDGGWPLVARPLQLAFHYGWNRLALGDLDGDGALDVVVGGDCRGMGCAPSGGGPPNSVHFNDGAGGFGPALALTPSGDTRTTSVVLGDVDGDGDLDVVFGNLGITGSGHENSPQNLLFVNDGARSFHLATSGELPVDLDDTTALAWADLDGDGDRDLCAFNAPVDPGESPRSKVLAGAHRHLHTPWPMRVGAPFRIELHGALHGGALLAAPATGRAALPPYGVLGLDPGSTIVLAWLPAPAAGRVAALDLPIPPVAGLAGLPLFLQGLVAEPALRLTNVRDEVFVPR